MCASMEAPCSSPMHPAVAPASSSSSHSWTTRTTGSRDDPTTDETPRPHRPGRRLDGDRCLRHPTNGPPSAIAKDNVPFPLLNPVASTTTTNPATPPAVAVPETIYLVAPSQHVIAVSRDVQIPATLTH